MIVITNPVAVHNEISIIRSLFESGLELLHIRKPDYSEAEMISLLTAIGSDFNSQLVLHSHHHLSGSFGINRLHNPEAEIEKANFALSASTHSIAEFNALENNYGYAFLSPVYPSISKPGYHSEINLLESVKERTNFNTKLVALGGISQQNITKTLKAGFDEVALLGTIWNSTNPLENFKLCQQTVHSF
ncbi:thiamine phosphate synthase [Flavobacterium amniphilum]|uniref:thiamine phosphate synthase n=1 Tax=Flavobacterium amniphilum TaxID=1834035 RepID=UPI00202A50EA|nr:thiamine phosphate synthase [Flavobacterium amniphilum]MCL9804165.1 thiamine phosphate synthase [Flavobacterium amniphilum]